MLNEIKPITIKTSPEWIQKYLWIIALPAVGIIFLAFSADNIIISSLGGIAFSALMIYGFIIIQRSKNFDKRMKRLSYIIVIPVISIMAGVIMRLFSSL